MTTADLPVREGNAGIPPRETRDWWRDAVVYQIYPRSFSDSDGDGLGDLPGIRARLPYLRDLGVDAIWLSPFYPSPLLDGGYDVADPRDVDSRLGSVADLRGIVEDSHALGLRVFVDVVPNHFSWDHQWFKEALATAKNTMAQRSSKTPRSDPSRPNATGISTSPARRIPPRSTR